jgi:hypothetical protein
MLICRFPLVIIVKFIEIGLTCGAYRHCCNIKPYFATTNCCGNMFKILPRTYMLLQNVLSIATEKLLMAME